MEYVNEDGRKLSGNWTSFFLKKKKIHIASDLAIVFLFHWSKIYTKYMMFVLKRWHLFLAQIKAVEM